ncbi:unnamed protein product [Ostreobium quekettii]|uniref:Uncharacterized protein n=1 Tax=Ostreobium quekettii TaxID=121088 RepID=A0A8S1JDY5_9CHLO|nr:unnamed protein product [Ostreobium quekettii]
MRCFAEIHVSSGGSRGPEPGRTQPRTLRHPPHGAAVAPLECHAGPKGRRKRRRGPCRHAIEMFKSRFNANRAKTQCRLCVGRIKLLKNKRNIQMAQMRKEVAELLRADRGEYAWIRVEAILREKNLSAAYEILELYLELLAVRAALVERAKEVPPDMVEAITSMMHAAPRVADLPELQQVRSLLMHRFGKELGPEEPKDGEESRWQVNYNLRRFLSVAAPQPEEKLSMLSKIAQEHDVDFDAEQLSITVMSHSESHKEDPASQKEKEYQKHMAASLGGGATAAGPLGATHFGRQKTHPGIEDPVAQPPPQMATPHPLPSQPSLPPAVPSCPAPCASSPVGAYTNAQTAATAAWNAAEEAKRAAAAAAGYAAQAPVSANPPNPATVPMIFGTPPAAMPAAPGYAVHTETSPPQAWAPPSPGPKPVTPTSPEDHAPLANSEPHAGSFKVKSQDELQRQYDAALGAPPKKDATSGPPSAPPMGGLPGAMPQVQAGSTAPPLYSESSSSPQVPHAPRPPNGVDPELPCVPQYPPPGVNLPHVPGAGEDFPPVPQGGPGVDDLPSVPIVPGGVADQPHDHMDELTKRLDDLKKD